jgi:hypothetical protein
VPREVEDASVGQPPRKILPGRPTTRAREDDSKTDIRD